MRCYLLPVIRDVSGSRSVHRSGRYHGGLGRSRILNDSHKTSICILSDIKLLVRLRWIWKPFTMWGMERSDATGLQATTYPDRLVMKTSLRHLRQTSTLRCSGCETYSNSVIEKDGKGREREVSNAPAQPSPTWFCELCGPMALILGLKVQQPNVPPEQTEFVNS